MPPSITVVGSINFDIAVRCERIPDPGETITDAESSGGPGGKGGNQAVAASLLGARVRLLGMVGDDIYADQVLHMLDGYGVDIAGVEQTKAGTGLAVVLVTADGENRIIVDRGANALLEALDVRGANAVLCQLEIPVETVVEAARQCRGYFCLNAAPACPVPSEVLERADLVVVNRYELEALASIPRLVALTLGEEGAILLEEGREVARVRPPKVEAVDGTAAGDAFTACLLVSILEGVEREQALYRACIAGAIAASREGAQASLPWRHEIDALAS